MVSENFFCSFLPKRFFQLTVKAAAIGTMDLLSFSHIQMTPYSQLIAVTAVRTASLTLIAAVTSTKVTTADLPRTAPDAGSARPLSRRKQPSASLNRLRLLCADTCKPTTAN